MRKSIAIAGLILVVLAGAFLWARSWVAEHLSALPPLEALERLDQGTIQGGPGSGRKIVYLAGGDPDEPRIVYVHGTPGNARGWLGYLLDPLPGYYSLAYDRPGFGRTLPSGPVSSLAGQAQALAGFLEIKKGRRSILVGHSLGGPIVCRAAVDFPDRVAGLVVISGSLDPDLEKVAWYQRAALWPGVRSLLPQSLANSNRELLPLKKELEELMPLLARIRCPVVIIHGFEDGLVPVANVAFLRSALTGSARVRTIVHQGMGHFLIWKNKETIRQDLARAAALIEEETTGRGS